MTDEVEKVQINVQLPLNIREDFRRVAKAEGKSMSAMLYRYIIMTIRQARADLPEIFEDYTPEPPPKIVGESEFDQLLLEAFDGKRPADNEMRVILRAIKEAMKVQEISN